MKIRAKVLLTIATTAVILVAVGLILAMALVLARFRDMDRERLDQRLHTLQDTIARDVNFLRDKTSDWGLWDDAYTWSQDRNPAFVASNVGPDAARAARLECILFLGFDGQILASSTADLSGTGPLAKLPFEPGHLAVDGPILDPLRKLMPVSGLLKIGDEVVAVAALAVRKSDQSGTPTVAVVMARRIDALKVGEWEEILGSPVARIPLPAGAVPGLTISMVNDERMDGTVILPDLLGRPALAVHLDHRRDIWNVGQRTILELLIASSAAGIVLVICLMWLLDRVVVRPIARLAAEVRDFERDGSMAFTVEGDDEITVLARTIRSAVDRQRSAVNNAGALERRWRTLFERSADAVILVDGDVIRVANQAARQLFRLPPGHELTGRSWRELMSGVDSPSDSTSSVREVSLHTGDGVERIVEMRQSAVELDGLTLGQVLLHDITERRAAERDRRLLASMADHTADAVAITRISGEVIYLNLAIRTLAGISPDGEVGEFARELFALEHRQALANGMDHALIVGGWRGELEVLTLAGQRVPVSVVVVVIREEDGTPTHLGLVLRNITVERQRQVMLEQARSAAEASAKAKADFLAVMSHELRTPLNGIIGMTSLLKMGHLTEDQRDQLGTISLCASHLLAQINDVLDLSRLEAGKVEAERIPFEIRSTVTEVQQMLGPQVAEKGLDLDVDLDPALPTLLVGDPTRLRQVLLNLVGNALKFTEHGSVLIQIRANGARLRIRVRDTGIGIPSEVLSRLFNPFVQADSSITRTHGGTGLGLVICRRLCELMGGSISVSSTLGEGSEFTVDLPLVVAIQPVEDNAPAGALGRRNLGLHVLVADDAATNQILTRRLLAFLGCTCSAAGDGDEALTKMAEERFDIVLMDGQMPDLDGLEATRRWRLREQQEGRPRLPIIALTALAQAGDEERFLAAGADGYLAKPFTLDDLAGALAPWAE